MFLLHDMITFVQLTCLLVYTTRFAIARGCTFVGSVWSADPLQLVPALRLKTEDCSYKVRGASFYAFENVNVVVSRDNAEDIFANQASQMYLSIYFCAFALLFSMANRVAVELNFFSFRCRNFIFRKDIITATELALLCLVLHAALMANVSGKLLRDYLQHCGVTSHVYLPFLTPTALFVFVGAGFFVYAVGIVLYLWNALPKYGILTAEEIADYRLWLRNRRRSVDEARRAAREARIASRRLRLRVAMGDGAPLRPTHRPERRNTPDPWRR